MSDNTAFVLLVAIATICGACVLIFSPSEASSKGKPCTCQHQQP